VSAVVASTNLGQTKQNSRRNLSQGKRTWMFACSCWIVFIDGCFVASEDPSSGAQLFYNWKQFTIDRIWTPCTYTGTLYICDSKDASRIPVCVNKEFFWRKGFQIASIRWRTTWKHLPNRFLVNFCFSKHIFKPLKESQNISTLYRSISNLTNLANTVCNLHPIHNDVNNVTR
jgi:hypothetical protein